MAGTMTTGAPLAGCSGRKLVNRLRFKPAHAVAAQTNYRNQLKALEEGTGFVNSEQELALPPDTFKDKLQKAIATLEEQVSLQASGWLREPPNPEPDEEFLDAESRNTDDNEIFEEETNGCFDVFVKEAQQIVFSYFEDRAAEKEVEFHKQLTKKTKSQLHEAVAYRDRLAPWLRSVDITCQEVDLPLYKPLAKYSQDQQNVMKEMIDERLRQLLALHQLRQTPEVEEEEEEEAVVEEVKVEVVVEKEDPVALQAERDKELGVETDKLARKQAENDELMRLLEELRKRLEKCNGEVHDLKVDVHELNKQLNAPEEPIPVPKLLPVKSVAPAPAPKAPPRVAPRPAPKAAAPAPKEVVVEEQIDYEAIAREEKAMFDEQLAQLIQDALAKNAKEWKAEKAAMLKRIKDLEGDVGRAQARRAEKELSRASTELPTEPSFQEPQTETMAEKEDSIEEPVPIAEMRSSVVEVSKPKFQIPKHSQDFCSVVKERGSVFDGLYTEAALRAKQMEVVREDARAAAMEEFKRTEQKRQRFGASPGGHAVPMGGLNSSSNSSQAGMSGRRTALNSSSDPRSFSGSFGNNTTAMSGSLSRALGNSSSMADLKRQAATGEPGALAALQGLAASGEPGALAALQKQAASGEPGAQAALADLKRLQRQAASGEPGAQAALADLKRQAESGGLGGSSSMRELRSPFAQSDGQLRVRLRGPLPALGDWLQPMYEEGLGGGGSTSIASSKRTNAIEHAPYDILRPTLRQVDANCKLPTALSRMAVETQYEPRSAAEIAAGGQTGARNEWQDHDVQEN